LPFCTFFYLFLPYFTLRKQRFKRYAKKATQNTNFKGGEWYFLEQIAQAKKRKLATFRV
jgi:hypothetical protein